MTKHCMIDLETLGVNSQSPITQVGIAIFDKEKIIESKNFAISFEHAFNDGVPDGSTVKWWLKQDITAKQKALEGSILPKDAANNVSALLQVHGCDFYWAHATFDFPIIASWFNRLQVKNPIDFRKCRDMRTIEHFFGNEVEWHQRSGTHHSAVDDAIWQAEMVIKMLKIAEVR